MTMGNGDVSAFAFYFALGFGFLALVAAIVWAFRTGAMRNDEDVKYRMLEEDGGRDVRE